MTFVERFFPLLGRIFLALIFVWSGFGKVGGFEGTVGYIGSKGLPAAQLLAVAAIIIELGGGIALILGWLARWAAAALAVFTLLAAFLFHNYWAVPAEQVMMQQIQFMKNLAITGGLLMVLAFGPGAWALSREKK